ncbi:MAG: hypothetical protein AAFQ64_06910 [Pseudomonadota bacterium]
MAQSSLNNPRIAYWRDQKIGRAHKVTTRRALERELSDQVQRPQHPIRQRMVAQAYWTRPHPWSETT